MKPLYLTFATCFLSFTGMTASRVVLSLFALHLGASASEVGVLAAMFFAFPLLLSWPVGALSDRIGPRGPLLLSTFFGGFGLLLPFFFQHIWVLYVAAAMNGLALACYHVNLQTLVGRLSTSVPPPISADRCSAALRSMISVMRLPACAFPRCH